VRVVAKDGLFISLRSLLGDESFDQWRRFRFWRGLGRSNWVEKSIDAMYSPA